MRYGVDCHFFLLCFNYNISCRIEAFSLPLFTKHRNGLFFFFNLGMKRLAVDLHRRISVATAGRMILWIRHWPAIWWYRLGPLVVRPLGTQTASSVLPFPVCKMGYWFCKTEKYQNQILRHSGNGTIQVSQVVLTVSVHLGRIKIQLSFFFLFLFLRSSTQFSCLQREVSKDHLILLFFISLIIWQASRMSVVQIPKIVECISLTSLRWTDYEFCQLHK